MRYLPWQNRSRNRGRAVIANPHSPIQKSDKENPGLQAIITAGVNEMSCRGFAKPNRRDLLARMAALGATSMAPAWGAGSKADLILRGGQVWSMGRRGTAVAIAGNRILAMGSDDAVMRHAARGTRIIDLKGRFVMPGFNDSHAHMTGLAQQYNDVPLLGSRTISDVVERIGRRVNATPPGIWVKTRAQWHEALLLEGRMPTRKDLDPVSPNNPVYVPRGGHVITVNSKALQLAGITRDTPNPPGGIIVRDADGEPTGMLLERARALIERHLPPLDAENYAGALKGQINELVAAGLTSLTNPSTSMPQAEQLQRLRQTNQLDMRVHWAALATTADDIRTLRAQYAPFQGDHLLRFSGIGEIQIDGGVEGAYLREPYRLVPGEQNDPNYRGVPMPLALDEAGFDALLLAAIDADYNFMIHITGDAALDMGIAALTRVQAQKTFRHLRWVLHGCFLTDEAQLAAVRKLGLYITGQSQPYLLGAQMVKWWGQERADRSMPFKAFLEAGLPVGGGSDAPAGIAVPMESVSWMVNRLCLGDVQLDRKWSLTVEEALILYTTGSATSQFMDGLTGKLEPGMLADVAILAESPFRVRPAELAKLENDASIMDGKVVFDRHKLLS